MVLLCWQGVRFPGTRGKVLPAMIAMLVGWGFKGSLTKCHDSLEDWLITVLTETFDRETLDELELVTYEVRCSCEAGQTAQRGRHA